jgi:hypothetical protein
MEHEHVFGIRNEDGFEYDEDNDEDESEEITDYDIYQQILNNPNLLNYDYFLNRLKKIINDHFMPKTE